MPDIQLLTQETIDKIAAGEVVERPSSVVKELVENALDAGASAVTVEIKDGGISLIRITDNGCGISRGQVPVAFLRHSTSKIRSIEDLLDIHSLGFRGEALSSIAAVSRVELITKTPDELTGTRYVIEGSKEMANEEVGAPEGTTFLVRDLFYNTPARRKFLKTATTEGNYIYDIVEKLALSHPNVSFKYIQNNQTKMHSSGNGNVKDLIYHIYGREIASALFPVEYQGTYFDLKGFIGKPVITRGNRNFENYYINGRYVKSSLLSKAIEDAYKNFLMQHQYPFTVLYFTFHGDIDVNVHPTKMEMRFGNNQEVYANLCNCLFDILSHKDMIPVVPVKDEKKTAQTDTNSIGKMPGKALGPEPFEKHRINDIRKSIAKDSPYEYKYPQRNGQDTNNGLTGNRTAETQVAAGQAAGNPALTQQSTGNLVSTLQSAGNPQAAGQPTDPSKPQVVLLRKRVTTVPDAASAEAAVVTGSAVSGSPLSGNASISADTLTSVNESVPTNSSDSKASPASLDSKASPASLDSKASPASLDSKASSVSLDSSSASSVSGGKNTTYNPMRFMGLSEFFEKTAGISAVGEGTRNGNKPEIQQDSKLSVADLPTQNPTSSALPTRDSELLASALPTRGSESSASNLSTRGSESSASNLSTRDSESSALSLSTRDSELSALPTRDSDSSASALPPRNPQLTTSDSQTPDSNSAYNVAAFLDYKQQTLEDMSPDFMTKDARRKHRIIGQLFKTYWLVEYEDQLFIIDQHAAHEKVLFEKTMRRLKDKEFTSQTISPPIVMTLDARETEMLEKYRPQIEMIGYEVEHFGGKEYMITAVPDNLFHIDMKDLFIEMLDDFTSITGRETPELILEKVASMSCKAAVKGNDALSLPEVQALFDDLFELDNPYNCPHGRPTIISMTKYEIEKKFKRIV